MVDTIAFMVTVSSIALGGFGAKFKFLIQILGSTFWEGEFLFNLLNIKREGSQRAPSLQ